MRYNLWCIGWSQGELARRVRLDESTIRQICRGARRCPDDVAVWVEQLARIHRALWEPPTWVPIGVSSLKYLQPDPRDDPDDTEVAPERPVTSGPIPRDPSYKGLSNEQRLTDAIDNETS
jgi:transcriptional regulator with XRE-family HTH domain